MELFKDDRITPQLQLRMILVPNNTKLHRHQLKYTSFFVF